MPPIGLSVAATNFGGTAPSATAQSLSEQADLHFGVPEAAKQFEESRLWIALIIVGSMAFIVVASFALIYSCRDKIDDVIKLVQLLIAPVIGVVGAVTGFYYGSRGTADGKSAP